MVPPVRIKRLDILRSLAIFMVVGAHARMPLLERAGWSGVDLFFVLSGFLISGLLYSEFKKRGTISFKRFFIRRGFKIYPPFYVMLLATYLAQRLLWHAPPQSLGHYLREIFFVQNYRFAIWTHTWSLAVEEHFYIALALLLLACSLYSAKRSDPFRKIPWIFAFLAVTCLALRILTIRLTPASEFLTPQVMNPTHLRIDALFFGVLLGYLYHFRPDQTRKFSAPRRTRIVLAVACLVLLSPAYVWARDSYAMLTFGLTSLYLGYGCLLVLSLEVHDVLPTVCCKAADKIGNVLAYIGTHSYSIYLWHVPFLVALPVFFRKALHIQPPELVIYLVSVVGSCVLGIVLANLIEFPALRLRDKLFPASQKHRSVPTASQPGEPQQNNAQQHNQGLPAPSTQ